MYTSLKKNLKERDIRALIMHTVQEVLNDPDFGLELSQKAKQRLRSVQKTSKRPVSFAYIKKQYS